MKLIHLRPNLSIANLHKILHNIQLLGTVRYKNWVLFDVGVGLHIKATLISHKSANIT